MSELNDRQKAFCDHYLKSGHITQAAIEAGYKKETAYSMGSRLLKNVKIIEYINRMSEKSVNERIAGAEEVLEYLSGVMRGSVKDSFGLDASLSDRTKAAELLAKRYRIFEKQETKTENNISIEVKGV